MLKNLIKVSALLSLALFASIASAQENPGVVFPIPELGNCASKEKCKAYCEEEANRTACIDFAAKNNLIKEEEVERVKNLPKTGPGGCEGEEECRDYCNDISHQEECIKFAEDNGFISKEDAERARKLMSQTGPGGCRGEECRDYCNVEDHKKACLEYARENGLISEEEAALANEIIDSGGPGGCKGERECQEYCENENNLIECTDFAVKHGFISKDEAERIKKVGIVNGPGGCKGKECRDYCEDENHFEECIRFAEEKGLMNKEDAERARKMVNQTGPGGCRGEECRDYCANPDNAEVCLEFAEQNGFIKGEEAARAKRFLQIAKQGGPGGCKGAECRDYCSDPNNQEACFKFAKENNLISEEEQKQFEAGQKLHEVVKSSGGPGGCKTEEECKIYCSDESHAEECVAFAVSHGGIDPEKAKEMLRQFKSHEASGQFGRGSREFEDESFKKFEEFRKLEGQFTGDAPGFKGGFSGEFSGPGGCKSPVECRKYCSEHIDECANFKPSLPPGIEKGNMNQRPETRPTDGAGAGFVGPGGCKSAEECARFCLNNLAECQNFAPIINPDQIEKRERERMEQQQNRQQRPPDGFRPGEPENGSSNESGGFQQEQQQQQRHEEFTGPGGCRGEQECAEYCASHSEECDKFEGNNQQNEG